MRDTKGEEKPWQVTLSADGGKWEMQSGQGARCLRPPKEALVGVQTKEQVHKDHRASRAWEETVREPQKSRAVARQSRTRGRRAKAPLRALSAVRAAASLRKKALGVDAGSLKATATDWTCGAPAPRPDLEIHVHWIKA